ncbi:MAG: hypothetical protein ACREPG_06495 [Candidatus Binatia bacterium]
MGKRKTRDDFELPHRSMHRKAATKKSKLFDRTLRRPQGDREAKGAIKIRVKIQQGAYHDTPWGGGAASHTEAGSSKENNK